MTSLRLIARNVRRHLHDYGLYFFTLVLAVALFYAFGAIGDQPALKDLGMTKQLLADQLNVLISLLSWVVAAVLAFLIFYASAFLLKRRKKELGIYLLLGMRKRRLNALFAGETLSVGFLALVCGLLLGLALAQGLSLVALRLFAVDLDAFQLSFSATALLRTIGCFVLIDGVVVLLNGRTIAHMKLIDLLTAARQHDALPPCPSLLQGSLLLVALAAMGGAVGLLHHYGILPSRAHHGLEVAMVLLAAGILLFFLSLSSLLLRMAEQRDRYYLRGLNSFFWRQLGGTLRSDFITLAIVCGLLIVAISALTVGASSALTMNQASQAALPFDLNVISDVDLIGDTDIQTYLEGRGVDVASFAEESAQISLYDADLTYGDLFSDQDVNLWPIDAAALPETPVSIVSISDFNRSLAMQGKPTQPLAAGTCLMNCNYKGTRAYIDTFLQTHDSVTIQGQTLRLASQEALSETYWMTSVGNNDRGTLIVPDDVANSLHKDANVLLVNERPDTDKEAVLAQMIPIGLEWETEGYRYTERNMLNDMYYGTGALLVFICCYIGLVFLLVCAVLLSLKQLTAVADSTARYQLLRKLGAPTRWLSQVLLRQTAVFFLAPLVLAAVLSGFVVAELTAVVEEFMNMHITTNMALTLALFLLIYGGYFLATVHLSHRCLRDE